MANDRHSYHSNSGDSSDNWLSHRTHIMKNNSDNRDELAAMAMPGIAAKWEYFDKQDCMEIAIISYRIADAMIACKKGYSNGLPEI